MFGSALLPLDLVPPPAAGIEIPAVSGNPARGRDAFIHKGCVACHSVRGAGGRIGPDLAAALVGKGMAGIAAALLSHYPRMSEALQEKQAPLPRLSAAEMDDLVVYLLFTAFAREPASAENGQALFSAKHCIKCHARVPGGASAAPPLGRASVSAPPILVAESMWNHGTQMQAGMAEQQIEPSTFEGQEMADLLAFLSGAAEPLPGREVSLPGDPVAGRDLFQSKGCAGCHLKGEGGTGIGPDLAAGGWYRTATEIAGAMWNHGPAMRAQMSALDMTAPRFESGELADVIAYLYLLRSVSEPGDPGRGRDVFRDGHCAGCHRPDGRGPDLAAVGGLETPLHFAAAMWNHAPRMQAFITEAGLSWPTFEASDVTDLVAFLRPRDAQAHQ